MGLLLWTVISFASDLFFFKIEMSDSSPVVTKNDISEEKETLNENKSVQVLRKINRDLKAIHLQVEKKLKRNLSSQEWIYIALIIDRLLFFFYILFISVSFITILIIWVVSYNKAWIMYLLVYHA